MNDPNPSSHVLSSDLHQQLYGLLLCLHQMGRELPQVLLHLTEIIQPKLSAERVVPVLGKMFEEIPLLLQQNPEQLSLLVMEPPPDLNTLRLLLDFRELQQVLQTISYLQILHLTNNIIPPGPQTLQLDFLLKAQEIFQSWSRETLTEHHRVLSETPLHMERQELLQREPQIPWELLHFLIELLKLPLQELHSFQDWISKLPKRHLLFIVQLLQMEPSLILEIKRRLDLEALEEADSNNMMVESTWNDGIRNSANQGTAIQQTVTNPPPFLPTNMESVRTISPTKVSTLAASTDLNFQLRIARQPPSRTVYQRILKPFPAIMLIITGNPDQTSSTNLFVEASLLRSDLDVELPLCIEGNRIVRISNGVFATFKKLKILSTSQQQGTLFRLRFTLKKYVGNVFEQIPTASVTSNPVEVFSHTLYLTEKQEVAPPPPPTITEVLPVAGGVGTRLVILGSNFVNSPNLRARFGDIDVSTLFHEAGTLICTVPQLKFGPNPVRVTNDSVNYCETKVVFHFQ